jgi:hypothetical protein
MELLQLVATLLPLLGLVAVWCVVFGPRELTACLWRRRRVRHGRTENFRRRIDRILEAEPYLWTAADVERLVDAFRLVSAAFDVGCQLGTLTDQSFVPYEYALAKLLDRLNLPFPRTRRLPSPTGGGTGTTPQTWAALERAAFPSRL